MKILATGLTGLVGSRVSQILSDVEFTSISRSTGIDITNYVSLVPVFESFEGKYVLHMAAKADVDGCEADKAQKENGEAWKINVLGTENIANLCYKFNKTLIYISTDMVFSGEKPEGEAYIEEDEPDPIDWYAVTKYEGEKRVLASGTENTILRIAYPYGNSPSEKKDFVHIIGQRLKEGKPIRGVTDHIMCPTFIDDLSQVLKTVTDQNTTGLYHAVGNTPLSPFDAACVIAKKVGVNPNVIGKTTRAEYFMGKAPRPFNLYLKNDKMRALGVTFKTFEEGVKEITF